MADTATLNVRMDANTKRDFGLFCEELGISASSLMNIFAKTVVRNQAVPFPLTSQALSVPQRYARLFPKTQDELMDMLSKADETPVENCLSHEDIIAAVKEHMVNC